MDGGDIVQQIQDALAPLADKLNEGARYLWEVYYKQNLITGAVGVLFGFVTAFAAWRLGKIATKNVKAAVASRLETKKAANFKYPDFSSDEHTWTIVGSIAGFVCFVLIIVSIVLFADNLPRMFNPGYYTIHTILQDVRGN